MSNFNLRGTWRSDDSFIQQNGIVTTRDGTTIFHDNTRVQSDGIIVWPNGLRTYTNPTTGLQIALPTTVIPPYNLPQHSAQSNHRTMNFWGRTRGLLGYGNELQTLIAQQRQRDQERLREALATMAQPPQSTMVLQEENYDKELEQFEMEMEKLQSNDQVRVEAEAPPQSPCEIAWQGYDGPENDDDYESELGAEDIPDDQDQGGWYEPSPSKEAEVNLEPRQAVVESHSKGLHPPPTTIGTGIDGFTAALAAHGIRVEKDPEFPRPPSPPAPPSPKPKKGGDDDDNGDDGKKDNDEKDGDEDDEDGNVDEREPTPQEYATEHDCHIHRHGQICQCKIFFPDCKFPDEYCDCVHCISSGVEVIQEIILASTPIENTDAHPELVESAPSPKKKVVIKTPSGNTLGFDGLIVEGV